MSDDPASDVAEFLISRSFDAPRDLVWKCQAELERLKQWWSPKGFTLLAAKLDLRTGGTFHYGLRAPDGAEIWGKFVYREIAAPKWMNFLVSFSDARGGTTRHPRCPSWPLETLYTVSFTEEDQRTTVAIQGVPYRFTDSERRAFESGRESMRMGFNGILDQLETYLARVQAVKQPATHQAAA